MLIFVNFQRIPLAEYVDFGEIPKHTPCRIRGFWSNSKGYPLQNTTILVKFQKILFVGYADLGRNSQGCPLQNTLILMQFRRIPLAEYVDVGEVPKKPFVEYIQFGEISRDTPCRIG